MLEAISYINFIGVSICALLAIGSIPMVLREPAPRSSLALGAAFTLLALGYAFGFERGSNEIALLVVAQNAVWCIALACLWTGTWMRAGYPPDKVFVALLIAVWMIPNFVFAVVIPNVSIRLIAAFLSILMGLGSCMWRLWHKTTAKNTGDHFLIAWFFVILCTIFLVLALGLQEPSEHRGEILLYYLAVMPVLFTGMGLFLYQSYALDALNEMERQARTDILTGLKNRRAFDEELTIALARAKRYGRPLTLVMTDIDHFKAINDRFGHPYGDSVIREFSNMLREESREVDTIARIGGEEFAVVVPEIDSAQAVIFAERLRQATESIVVRDATLAASFGVASTTHSDYSGSALIQDADAALYIAKQSGRNRVEVSGALSGVAQPHRA